MAGSACRPHLLPTSVFPGDDVASHSWPTAASAFFDVYEATVFWERRRRRIPVDEANSDPLVGMALLEGSELNVQVRPGGKVTIKRLP